MLVEISGKPGIYCLTLKKASGLTNIGKLQMARRVQSSYVAFECFCSAKIHVSEDGEGGVGMHSCKLTCFVQGILLVWRKQSSYIAY